MGNTLQPNPSNAADDLVQPDWNSQYSEGVAPVDDAAVDFQESYKKQREGAKARVEEEDSAS